MFYWLYYPSCRTSMLLDLPAILGGGGLYSRRHSSCGCASRPPTFAHTSVLTGRLILSFSSETKLSQCLLSVRKSTSDFYLETFSQPCFSGEGSGAGMEGCPGKHARWTGDGVPRLAPSRLRTPTLLLGAGRPHSLAPHSSASPQGAGVRAVTPRSLIFVCGFRHTARHSAGAQ